MKIPWLWVAGVGAVAVLYATRDTVGSGIATGVEDVHAAISGWKSVGKGPQWVPVLNAAESLYSIPTDVLARIAYQESRFRQDVIDGTKRGGAGELGIMQLLPPYYSSINAPIPFSPQDTSAQITEAAQELARLYTHYGNWGLSVAAYNDGQGNIDRYLAGQHALPKSTADYVAAVFTDVPVAGATLPT